MHIKCNVVPYIWKKQGEDEINRDMNHGTYIYKYFSLLWYDAV